MTVQEVLTMLNTYRSSGEIEYSAYSALFDAISELADGDKAETVIQPS